MAILFKNNAASTLDYMYQAPDKDFVDIYVIDPTVFPTIAPESNDYFYLTLVGENALEIVKVFAQIPNVNTGKLAFRSYRAQEGTTAQEWAKGTRVELRITAGALDSFVPTAVQIAKDNVDAIGVASTTNVGFAGVDGQTTQANVDGVITAKDVAIGGNLADLATARGQLGPAKELGNGVDYNTVTEAGFYLINASDSVNGPLKGSDIFLHVFYSNKGALTKNLYQIAYAYSSARERMFIRQYRKRSNDWSSWSEILSSASIGDGIRINNGIISVPEYEGATASKAGTSGLVPPAAAGQHESFLTGGGEYKPALTKISDSVNLADSKMAASAKAVKTAYDLAADAKQKSNTSGTADYANGLRGIPLQWVGRGASPEFLLGRLGQEPFDAFRPMHIEGVGSAKAWKAQNSGGNYVLYDEVLGENPTYIMGYALNGIFKIYTTSALSVNYANSAGSAPANGGTSWATTVMPNVAFVGRDGAIPNGGTWLYIYMPYGSHYLRGVTLAGGATAPSNDGGIAIRVA